MDSPRLILASGSPRRRELLDRLTLEFTVEPADVDESVAADESAVDYVSRLALEKASKVARPGSVVIGADTAVVTDGEVMGKPSDPADAHRMLEILGGREHEVVTGVAVVADADRAAVGTEFTRVHVDRIDRGRAEWYVGTGEPDDKAGAYALQGAAAIFADRVDGSVSNVIGLPLPLVDRLFGELGLDLLEFRRGRP